jgi:exosortase A-associated hydrolase 1
MGFDERPVLFDCEGERLIGVLTQPSPPRAALAVVIVAGAPQYRVGAHRQFVSIARALVAAGVAVLRFDYRGTGDATGAPRSFEEINSDIAAAIDTIANEIPSVRHYVLLGLCDGASALLLYWHARRDPRVVGMVLLNPWVRSEESLAAARIRGYYGARVLDAIFWRGLVRGQVNIPRALRSLLANVRMFARATSKRRTLPWHTTMAESLLRFDGPIMILLGGRDLTALEFSERLRLDDAWRDIARRPNVVIHHIAGADHTFSTKLASKEVETRTREWLESRVGAGAR